MHHSQRQNFFSPASRDPKRKAGNEQFHSRQLWNPSQCAPLTPVHVKHVEHRFRHRGGEGRPGREAGRDQPAASSGGGLHPHLPRPSRSLIPALMDIKNRTKQDWRWEQNPRTTGLDRCSHSAVKCKNKKGQTSCIPQDASRFFNIAVPPHISLRMLHYIYMSLKYLPFF